MIGLAETVSTPHQYLEDIVNKIYEEGYNDGYEERQKEYEIEKLTSKN